MILSAEALLAKQYQLSLRIHVSIHCSVICDIPPAILLQYELQAQTCSYRRFQLEQLSCAHAMIAIRHMKGDVYDLCSDYYLSECWKAIYAGVVYSLPHQANWVVPNEIREKKLSPPDVRTVSGRHRKNQIPYVGETVQHQNCS